MDIKALIESGVIASTVQFGTGAVVLFWFMVRAERRMRAIESNVNEMSKAILVFVMSIPNASEIGKAHAERLLAKIEKAEEK